MALLALHLFAAWSSAADLLIERTRTIQILDDAGQVDSSREWPDILYASDIGVRWDARSTSTIVRADGDTLVYVDHRAKSYAEVTLPLRLEDLLTIEETECLSHHPLVLVDAEAEVTLTGETRLIGQWKTTRLRVVGQHPFGLRIERDTWITHDLPVDLGPYLKMVQNMAALSTLSRAWFAEYLAAGGFPVESTTVRRYRGKARRLEQRLDSVTEVEVDPARYRPPAGYSPTLKRPPLDVACVSGQ